MAKRRNSSRRSYNNQTYERRGKSEGEARVERMTWFFLVLIFAVLQILEASVPNWVVPFTGAVVLLGSGLYQYSRHWRVSPVTWLAGSLLAALAFFNLQINPERNFLGVSLLVFAGVILFGLLTGET